MVRSVCDRFSTHCWFEFTSGFAFMLGLFYFLLSCVRTRLTIFRSYFQGGGEEKKCPRAMKVCGDRRKTLGGSEW